MGAVHFGLDNGLIDILQAMLPLRVFVETGTFEGDTLDKAKDRFEHLYSAELSDHYFSYAQTRFRSDNKILLFHGSSERMLVNWKDKWKDESTLFWLDAHWCVADKTAGGETQCPLLKELSAIKELNAESIILIDDARFFLCAPPETHNISDWPVFDEVVDALRSLSHAHQTLIINDVIVFAPKVLQSELLAYSSEHNVDMLTVCDKARDYDLLAKQLEEKEALINCLATQVEEKEELINRLSAQLKN